MILAKSGDGIALVLIDHLGNVLAAAGDDKIVDLGAFRCGGNGVCVFLEILQVVLGLEQCIPV
jgi:hypothetical protein